LGVGSRDREEKLGGMEGASVEEVRRFYEQGDRTEAMVMER
jgi:hypothetical protein